MCKLTALLVAALVFTAVEVGAQQLTVSGVAYAPLGIDDLDGTLPPQAEFRLSLPFSDRWAFEPFVSVGSGRWGTGGFYGVQFRHRAVVLRDGKSYVFSTYGASSYYQRGSDSPPFIGHFGVGLHHPVSRRVAFRPEVQLVTFHVVPIGVRFLAGVSVDLR